MSKRVFFFEFLKDWRKIGAFAPSSRFLANKMLGSINFDTARLIVEFGPGTGSFTKALLSKLHPHAKLFVFETNKKFCQALNKLGDKRLHVINDSADHLRKYLPDHKADYIVSGLPLAIFEPELKHKIIKAVTHSLADEGKFVQFQYLPESYGLLKSAFGKVKLKFTLLNTPPALVYVCSL